MKTKIFVGMVVALLAVGVSAGQGEPQGIHTPGTGLADPELKEADGNVSAEVVPDYLMAADDFMKGLSGNDLYIMSAEDLMAAVNAGDMNLSIIDVRPEYLYATGHINGSINIPDPVLVERMDEVPEGKRLAVVCALDSNTAFAVAVLRIFGGHDAWVVPGGVTAWVNAGGEVVPS